MNLEHVVVVGASLAGLRAVEQLRKGGFEGRLTLVGDEPHLPYNRPPLSKGVLDGTTEPETVLFRPAAHFEQLRLELLLGKRATGLDVRERKIRLADDSTLNFDGLVIATGAAPRDIPLPGRELDGIHLLRTLDDAKLVRQAFTQKPRVVIIGAGVIGAEVASSAATLGLDVTIVEAEKTPMRRSIGADLGDLITQLHQDHGIRARYGVTLSAFEGAKHVERVLLSDGSSLPADLVVIGAGVKPNIDWLKSSGLDLGNGLLCDSKLRAGPPNIVAAGDVVCWQNPLYNELMRQETWSSAGEQGTLAAKNLLAGDGAEDCATVPYFWSDQCGVRIQVAGSPSGDEIQVVDGSFEERRFLALVRRDEKLVGAVGMNSAKLLMAQRTKIAQRITWRDALAAAGGLPCGANASGCAVRERLTRLFGCDIIACRVRACRVPVSVIALKELPRPPQTFL